MHFTQPVLSCSICRWALAAFLLTVPHVARAQSWAAAAGAQSTDKAFQALAFLPSEMWIHAGDTITWRVASDEHHTITFLAAGQIRPPFAVGCPGTTPSGSSFSGSTCVNGGPMVTGQTYSVTFPTPGNFKLTCLVHANMTAVIHVLPWTEPLPHTQTFYDEEAAKQQSALSQDGVIETLQAHVEMPDMDHAVTSGSGEIKATAGGSSTVSWMRFTEATKVIHAGDTVEWTNTDPVTAHTITFGAEPANPIPPSANITVDADGARHATINAVTDSAHSGFIVAAPQDRIGLPQSPNGVTRFRVTFTHPGTYPYICALHDGLGMKGVVIVLP